MSTASETTRPDGFGAGEQDQSPVELSVYFLELERLLDRIESSTTHYQVLSLDRSATRDRIDRSYQHLLSLIYPEYSIGVEVPPGIAARLDRAFEKSSAAFSVLANFAKRREYDRTLLSKPVQDGPPPVPIHSSGGTDRSMAKKLPHNGEEQSAIRLSHGRARQRIYSESSRGAKGDNRRRCERIRLSIPARATGFDRKNGKWHEMAETVDVSRTGLRLRMRRPVLRGNILYLTLPLPTKLRSHNYSDAHYSVYTVVHRVESAHNGMLEVGLEFLGEHPPSGFLERPWAVFRKEWVGCERRRAPRVPKTEIVRVEYFSWSMEPIASEEARTESVSRTGLRIVVKAAPVKFDLVRVSCNSRGFEALAKVRNRFVAKDALERVCIQFIDKEWPL